MFQKLCFAGWRTHAAGWLDQLDPHLSEAASLQVPVRGPPAPQLQGHGRLQEDVLCVEKSSLLPGKEHDFSARYVLVCIL
jgi:hypothetical protein